MLHRKQEAYATEASPEPAAPPASAKRDAILAAARAVFLERGFANASMDAITRRAGVSKATVYAHFPGKLDLFQAIVQERCRAAMPAIEEAKLANAPPEEALRAIGRRFLSMLTADDTLDLHRVVLAEAGRVPELGRTLYATGPNRAAEALAEYLARELALERPRLAAEQFFGLVMGHFHLRRLLGVEPAAPAAAEIDAAVDQAVAIFLDGARK